MNLFSRGLIHTNVCVFFQGFWLKNKRKYFISAEVRQIRILVLYFVVSGEINVYLMKIKVVSITSELILYHFTSDWYRGYSNVWSEYDFYFIEWSEKMYISWVPKARMKYTFFHFTRWNKSHIHDKHLNFLFIIYITFDRRDANLAFARESLTRSFVPWRHDVHVLFCLVTLDMTSETRIGV